MSLNKIPPSRSTTVPVVVSVEQHAICFALPQDHPMCFALPQDHPMCFAMPQDHPICFALPKDYPICFLTLSAPLSFLNNNNANFGSVGKIKIATCSLIF